MELIAASRIVKAQARVHAAVPYADGITEVVRDLQAAGGEVNSPFLTSRDEVRHSAIVVLTADRGLCGAYNSSVLRAAEAAMRDEAALGRTNHLVTVGRKAEGYFRFRGYDIEASFEGFSDKPTYEHARGVAASVINRYADGELDLVQLAYTRFVTVGRQEVVVRPLLPLGRESFDKADGAAHGEPRADYEYEPGPDAILETLLPRYAEARVFAALLNAAASEHVARQRAMKAATDNAEELIRGLTRVMNRARQDAITTEIMEIVGGAEALGQGDEAHAEHTESRAHPDERAFLEASHLSA
jgi:F-type H+-transporting ATPase subunit gamma